MRLEKGLSTITEYFTGFQLVWACVSQFGLPIALGSSRAGIDERKFLPPLGRRAERPNAKAAKTSDQLMRRLEQKAAPASTCPLSRVRALGSLRLYRNLSISLARDPISAPEGWGRAEWGAPGRGVSWARRASRSGKRSDGACLASKERRSAEQYSVPLPHHVERPISKRYPVSLSVGPGSYQRRSPLATSHEVARSGVTLGSALAIAISWSVNKSILWAVIHGLLSWLYVLYYAWTR